MTSRFALPYAYVPTIDGTPMSGAKLYFYLSGTDTPKNTYSNPELTIPNTNPVIANAGGRFGNIFLDGVNYKVILRDADDVLIWTADPLGTEDTYESAIAYATGDGVETAFEIPVEWVGVISPLAMMVFWDGAQQDPNTYEIVGSDIVFSTAPPYNCAITLRNQTVGPRGIGNVDGPDSAVDSAIVAFDGVTGELIKDGSASDVKVTGLQAAGASGVVLKNSAGTTVATVGASGGDDATFADDVAVTGDLAVTGTTTTAAGTLAAPGLVIGPSGGGLYKGGSAPNTVQPVVGITVDAATGRAIQFGYNTLNTTGTVIEPAPAFTSTSAGQALVLRGGVGGTTSGNAGSASLLGGVPVDGNGGGASISGAAGVGTNRSGGAASVTAGNSTGTAAAAALTLTSGSNADGAAAGTVTLRTGTGAAADVNIDNRTAGSLLFRTDNVARWRINGSAAGNTGAMEPVTDNAWSVGSGGARPTELFAVSGTINTSDIRLKEIDAEAFPDPLALLNAIDPIAYRWIEGRKVVVGKRQVGIEVIDGTEEPIFEPIYESRPGSRVHLGFSAQQVHGALGGDQYAMWTLDDPSDPDSRQGLRTDQMIPILWSALKTALARIEALEAAE